MALNISSISTLISEFRLLTAKDSISPDSVGYLLQQIVNLVDTLSQTSSGSSSGGSSGGATIDSEELANLQASISQLQTSVGNLNSAVKSLQDETKYLSSDNDKEVLEFAGLLTGDINVTLNSATSSGTVKFSTTKNTFVYMVAGIPIKYMGGWDGANDYGSPSSDGVVPISGKLYLDTSTGILYRWNGKALISVSEYDDSSLAEQLDSLSSQLKALEAKVATYHSVYDGPDSGDNTEREQVRFMWYEPNDYDQGELTFTDELPEQADNYIVFWYPTHNRFYAWWSRESVPEDDDGVTPFINVGIAANWPTSSDYYADGSDTPRTDVYFVCEDEEGVDQLYYYSEQYGTLRPAGRRNEGVSDYETPTLEKVYVKTDEEGKPYIDLSEALAMLTSEEVKAILANS